MAEPDHQTPSSLASAGRPEGGSSEQQQQSSSASWSASRDDVLPRHLPPQYAGPAGPVAGVPRRSRRRGRAVDVTSAVADSPSALRPAASSSRSRSSSTLSRGRVQFTDTAASQEQLPNASQSMGMRSDDDDEMVPVWRGDAAPARSAIRGPESRKVAGGPAAGRRVTLTFASAAMPAAAGAGRDPLQASISGAGNSDTLDGLMPPRGPRAAGGGVTPSALGSSGDASGGVVSRGASRNRAPPAAGGVVKSKTASAAPGARASWRPSAGGVIQPQSFQFVATSDLQREMAEVREQNPQLQDAWSEEDSSSTLTDTSSGGAEAAEEQLESEGLLRGDPLMSASSGDADGAPTHSSPRRRRPLSSVGSTLLPFHSRDASPAEASSAAMLPEPFVAGTAAGFGQITFGGEAEPQSMEWSAGAGNLADMSPTAIAVTPPAVLASKRFDQSSDNQSIGSALAAPKRQRRRSKRRSTALVPMEPSDNPYGLQDDVDDDDGAATAAAPRSGGMHHHHRGDDDDDDDDGDESPRYSRRRKSRVAVMGDDEAAAALGARGRRMSRSARRQSLMVGDLPSPMVPGEGSLGRSGRRPSVTPQRRQSLTPNRRHSVAGMGSERFVRNPALTVREQFQEWSRHGTRRITLADEVATAFEEFASPPPAGALEASPTFTGDVSMSMAGFDESRAMAVALPPPKSPRAADGVVDEALPPSSAAASPKALATPRAVAHIGSRESAFRRRKVDVNAMSKRQRRAARLVRGEESSSSSSESEDQNGGLTATTTKKRRRRSVMPPSGMNEAEQQLLDAASAKLPVSAVIGRLKQEVDEMDTLQDCTVFIPFLGLFLAAFLLNVDITHTHFVVNSIRGVDTDAAFEYSAAQHAALSKELLRGEPLRTPAPQAPAPANVFPPDGNSTMNGSFSVPGSTAPGDWQSTSDGWRGVDWDAVPGRGLLEYFGLLAPVYRQGDPRIASKEVDAFVGALEPSFLEIASAKDFMNFFRDVFVPNNWPCSPDTQDFANTVPTRLGSTLLLGAARLRVLRVRPDSCRVPTRVLDRRNATDGDDGSTVSAIGAGAFASDEDERRYAEFAELDMEDQSASPLRCYGPWDSDAAERRDFCNVRNPATLNSTLFRFEECTAIFDEMERSRYPCSGYIIDLPYNASCRDMRELTDVIFPQQSPQLRDIRESLNMTVEVDRGFAYIAKDGSKCDSIVAHEATRFVAIEYMLLSKPTGTFHRVSFLLEVTAGGSWTPLYVSRVFEVWNTGFVLRTVFDVVILLGVLFFFAKFFRDWKQFRWRTGAWIPFLFDLWNVLEATNLVTFFVTLSLRWAWRALSATISVGAIQTGVFPQELDAVSALYTSSRFANAFNIVLSFLKLLKYLKMNERLGILTRTLYATQGHIMAILLLFCFLATGFAISGVLLYGMFLDRYRNFNTAFSTLFFMLLGEFDYPAMRTVQPLLTFSFFLSFVIIGLFLLLNFIIVILSEGFADQARNMNTLPLAESVMRLFEVARLIVRPAYAIEFAKRRFYERSRLAYMKQATDTLERHHELVIKAFLQGTVSAPEAVMDFEDLEWWLPPDVFDGLGRLFLMTLWEDCVFMRRWEASTSQSHEREILRTVITSSIGLIVDRCMVDVDLLDAHADRVDDAMSKLLPQLPAIERYNEAKKKLKAARERADAEERVRLQKLQAATKAKKEKDEAPLLDKDRFGPIQLREASPRNGLTAVDEAGTTGSSEGDEDGASVPVGDFIASRRGRGGTHAATAAAGGSASPDRSVVFRATGFGEEGSGAFGSADRPTPEPREDDAAGFAAFSFGGGDDEGGAEPSEPQCGSRSRSMRSGSDDDGPGSPMAFRPVFGFGD